MRVLFLTCHLPYPPVSGGRRREFELLTRLAPDVDFHVVAVSKTPREDATNARDLERLLRGRVEVVAARSTGEGAPQIVRHGCAGVRGAFKAPHDLVHVEAFYLMQHVPDPCRAPVLLVEQNVEWELWRQRGDFREASRTRTAEIAAWRRADLCAAVTAEDRLAMLRAAPDLDVRLAPDGVDSGQADVEVPLRHPPTALFVGNFAYEPNRDGLRWLLREVWPRTRGYALLQVVGNAAPRDVAAAGLLVQGRVPSLEPYYAAADVVLCPLRVGGGIKVKMLEALARGKAIVSTSVGVQGLRDAPVIVHDDAEGFAAGLDRLLRDADERGRLGTAAAAYARTLPTWDDAASALLGYYDELARSKSTAWPWPTPTQSVARP